MLLGDPPDYSQHIAMTVLTLTNNGLKSISGELLRTMTNLRNLNLIGNKLSTFLMIQLETLHNLQSVFLESNELKTFCDIGHRNRQGLRIEIRAIHWSVMKGCVGYLMVDTYITTMGELENISVRTHVSNQVA